MLLGFLMLILSFTQNIFSSDILDLVALKKNQLRLSYFDSRQKEVDLKIAALEKKIGIAKKPQTATFIYFEQAESLPAFLWQILFLLSLFIGLLFLRTKKYLALLFLIFTAFSGFVLFRKFEKMHQLVVVSDKAEFFAGPGERYPRLNLAPFGKTFCYSLQQNGFLKVDGLGWLEPSALMVLD